MTSSSKTADLLVEIFEGTYTREDLPSLTALVSRHGKAVWSKSYGYADLESGRHAGDQTIYHLGSLTKVFTAIWLLQLRVSAYFWPRTAGKIQELSQPPARRCSKSCEGMF